MNDWIGCLGATPRALMPNIDRLAAHGVNFSNAHTAGVFCAPSRASIFTGQYASATYFVDHPEIRPLQVSWTEGGYQTFGAGKLFQHSVGNIDHRGYTKFFLRSQKQRESGWPLDSWSEGVPFSGPFPKSIYNAGQKIGGGLFLEWGHVPNGKEEQLVDAILANYAVSKLKEKHDEPFSLALGLYAPHFPKYCP